MRAAITCIWLVGCGFTNQLTPGDGDAGLGNEPGSQTCVWSFMPADFDPCNIPVPDDPPVFAPGEYTLRVQANDSSGDGGGGFQCCWTNAHVKVAVK